MQYRSIDLYSNIRWKGAKERFATTHADELEQYQKAQRLLRKFGLSHPIERKSLRADKAQLEQEIEALRSEAEAYQSELDELKTVRYWVRKVIPDALPTPTESSKPSLYDTMDTTQNEKELADLLNRTTKQTIVPQHDKTQTITHPHCKETR